MNDVQVAGLIDGDVVGGTGWDVEVKANLVPADDVTRNSATQATILLPASANYDVSSQEIVTVTVPTDVLVTGAGALSAGSFTIDAVSGFVPYPRYEMSGGLQTMSGGMQC